MQGRKRGERRWWAEEVGEDWKRKKKEEKERRK